MPWSTASPCSRPGSTTPASRSACSCSPGPTGTGKTELAKTAAEFLFGSADRLIRLDMSELQTPESTLKILGGGEIAESDSLIVRVRKQPFSVVLLDEFEKAHANVWDLFLQVFDDGRLTDSLGNVADFRHCLIILTTNLGATGHRDSGLGFSPAASDFSGDQIMQAIGRTFRPEFQNRLDKVIVFHPLTRDLMRDILKKELTRVLERRGLKDREWAVEWEASALEFLLEKGFSPEMGARPLKRAIEQYVIAPLAATIVEKRFPEGDQFVFFRSDGRAIKAEFVDPRRRRCAAFRRGAVAGDGCRACPRMILAPEGTAAEMQVLEAEYSGICAGLPVAGVGGAQGPAGGGDAGGGLLVAAGPPRDAVAARPDGPRQGGGRHGRGAARAPRQGRGALRQVLARAGRAAGPAAAPRPRRASGTCSRRRRSRSRCWWSRRWSGRASARRRAPGASSCIAMYRAWAGNRHMQLAELSGMAAHDLPLLLISGFGAHRLLEKEAGLHVLERRGGAQPGDGARAARGDAAGRPAARQAAPRAPGGAGGGGQAACRGAPLPQRALAAGAQHERGLAHRPPRRRARRQLRPDRRQPGGGGVEGSDRV